MNTETPSYYAIKPSLIRYNKRLKPNATLFGRSVQTIIIYKENGKIPYFEMGKIPLFCKKQHLIKT